MAIAGNLVINLMGNTQHLNRALTRSASRIRAFSATSQRSLTSFSTTATATFAAVGAGAARARSALGNVALAMSGGIAVGTGLAFRNLVKFDDAIRAAGARARASAGELEMMRDHARELGRTSSFTQTQVAQMMGGLSKGGFKVKQTLGGMTKAVMDLTRAAGTDGEMAARLLGDSIGVFNLKASDSSKVASVLAGVLNRTRMDVNDLADGFKFAAKTGADLGMKFHETIAVMGTLAQAGLRGSLAGTAIRKIGQITVSEVGKVRKEFGITFKETKNGTVNVIENFEILSKSLQGLTRTDRLSKFFEAFGIRGAQAASSLADSAISTKALAKELKEVYDTGTEAATTAAAMDDGIGGSMRRLLSAAEEFGDMWASSFVKPVEDGIEAMRDFTTESSKFLKVKGIPDMQAGMGQTAAAGSGIWEGLVKYGPSLAESFILGMAEVTDNKLNEWGLGKESNEQRHRKFLQDKAAREKAPKDFLGGTLGPKQIANRKALSAANDKVRNGLTRFVSWLGTFVPSLPRPGGGLQNVPAGWKPKQTAAEREELQRLRGRLAEDRERWKPQPKRSDPFSDMVDPHKQQKIFQGIWGKFIGFSGKRYRETHDNAQAKAAAEATKGNELADKFKPPFSLQEETVAVESAARARIASPGRSGQVFGMQDVIRQMERQGADKRDIRAMIRSQEKLRWEMNKLRHAKEKTVRVEIAPEE